MATVVASIDFGTTFSSWAYQTHNDFLTSPTKVYTKQWTSTEPLSLKGKFIISLINAKQLQNLQSSVTINYDWSYIRG